MEFNEINKDPHDRLFIDIGNTSCKVAFAVGKAIGKKVQSREGEHPLLFLEHLLMESAFKVIVLSSVQRPDPELKEWLSAHCNKLIVVDGDTPTALRINYQTPDRLGADLLAGGVGAITLFPGEDLLVVDFGTAITVESSVESVVESKNGDSIDRVPPRDSMYMAKAPQSFRYGMIWDLYNRAREDKFLTIDSAQLLSIYGVEMHTVKSSPNNIKITSPADYYIFRALHEEMENQQIFGF